MGKVEQPFFRWAGLRVRPAQTRVATDLAALIAGEDPAARKKFVASWAAGSERGLIPGARVRWGSLMGSRRARVLKRPGFAPATSSAPFGAMRVDVTGSIMCFNGAFFSMRGTLLEGEIPVT